MNQHLIGIFADRFINRQDAYNIQWNNGRGYTAVYEPVTETLIAQHLEGRVTISIPALSDGNLGKWLLFDADTNNGELDKLESFLSKWGWHSIRDSKRAEKDGHLWLLFDEPLAGNCLVNLGKAIIKLSNICTIGIEVFPKQNEIEKLGSAVRLPINYHRKIKRRTWFDIPEKNLESQLTWLAEQPLNDACAALELAKEHKPIILPPIRSIRKYSNTANYNKINILDFVQSRRLGKELAAQCPLCAAEGHDKHRDNLRISTDGTKFCCWYGGAAEVHKSKDIVRALLTGHR